MVSKDSREMSAYWFSSFQFGNKGCKLAHCLSIYQMIVAYIDSIINIDVSFIISKISSGLDPFLP